MIMTQEKYIYVCAQSEGTTKEFKISYKKKNADFLENKMKSDRAEQIFGANWKEIIEENTKRISDRFEETPVLFLDQRKKTEPGSMTLGCLDYDYLVKSIEDIILDDDLLPASIGVYGDWGSGKSMLT